MTECGTATSDGNAIQVLQGEAIIKGGSIDGVLFNAKGKIELHGCVDYDEETQKLSASFSMDPISMLSMMEMVRPVLFMIQKRVHRKHRRPRLKTEKECRWM